MTVLEELLEVLKLERIEENIFRGQSQDLGWGRVFGGQVLGQALSAAEQTVPADRHVHSFHSYFLRPGDAKRPIVFTVDPIRDGRSFTTRRVVAVQNGKAIFHLSASFQIKEEGFQHQSVTMPEVPDPSSLIPERQLVEDLLKRLPKAVLDKVPPFMQERAVAERPIEIRAVAPIDPMKPDVTAPIHRVWFRAKGELPDTQSIHQHLLAYASDFHFLVTSLRPHGKTWLTPGMQVASLDHAMWFHETFRFDDWVLYDIDSPWANGARGLAKGRLFRRDGVLIAEAVQEGLIRNRRAKRQL